MNISNQVIDFADDVTKGILKLAGPNVPEAVLSQAVLTPEERDALPAEDFALVILTKESHELKKFPICDQGSTWLSCHYFQHTNDNLPAGAMKIAASNLEKACAVFGLAVPAIVKQAAVSGIQSNLYEEATAKREDKLVKVAYEKNSDHYFALGTRYPMPTAEFVKKAEAYFDREWRNFHDASDRYEFAHNVAARAKELGMPVESPHIKKYASDKFGSEVTTQLNLRKGLVDGRQDMTSAIDKLASHAGSAEADTFAKTLHMFDKKAGLEKYYDKHIKDAYSATFEVREEMAKLSGYRWEDTSSGVSLDETALVKCADKKYDKIKGYFGPTLADSLKKHAVAIFESLPLDCKIVIAKIANGSI
jgi:hypothetical protein